MLTDRQHEIIGFVRELAPVGMRVSMLAHKLGVTYASASGHLERLGAKRVLEKRGSRWFLPRTMPLPVERMRKRPPALQRAPELEALVQIEACTIVLQEAIERGDVEEFALRAELRERVDHYYRHLMGGFEGGAGI